MRMELQDAIKSRTSIRDFKDRKVDTDMVGIILRMGMCAPSASDKRPWRMWVVENEDTINALATATPYASTGMGIVDCSAVIQNMLLTITDLGLGAVWIGCWPHEDRQHNVREILGIPEGIDVVSFIVVGYPNEENTPKDKWDPKNVKWM